MSDVKEPIYEPRKFYEERLKQQYHDEATRFFDELVASSKVDVEGNRVHVADFEKTLGHFETEKKNASHFKGWRTFLIVLIVAGFLLGLLFTIAGFMHLDRGWVMPVSGLLLICLGVGLLLYLLRVLNPKIKEIEGRLNGLEKEVQKKKNLCFEDLRELNRSYDWNIPAQIMKKTTPVLDLDRYFHVGRFAYLVKKFGFPKDLGKDATILGVLSGNIQGNPFVLERDLSESIVEIPYTGSIVITWTTVHSSKDGTYTVTHTETLTATVTHPGPRYDTQTRLIYGNQAAPNLHFSRRPTGEDTQDEKKVSRFVKKRNKILDKKAKADLMDDDPTTNFTKIGNEKFDALFGADNRDNETEFRLLYTPLAQKNVLDLLMNPLPYGDDFVQVKEGMLNSIASRHSQQFDYSANPDRFVHFSVDAAKANFVSYCDDFIRCLYFDLAPLISIPLYQTHMPDEYIAGTMDDFSNFSTFEHEVMANSLDPAAFRPEEADPSLPLILKVSKAEKDGKDDIVQIHAYSFKTTPRTDYVSKLGGDGHMHTIPVHWVQYDRVEREEGMVVSDIGGTNRSYADKIDQAIRSFVKDGAPHYERGLLAYPANGKDRNEAIRQQILSIFSKEKEGVKI